MNSSCLKTLKWESLLVAAELLPLVGHADLSPLKALWDY